MTSSQIGLTENKILEFNKGKKWYTFLSLTERNDIQRNDSGGAKLLAVMVCKQHWTTYRKNLMDHFMFHFPLNTNLL